MATIFEETFETDGNGTRYTLSDPEFHSPDTTIDDDFFGRTNGKLLAGLAFSSSISYASPGDSFYFAANDTDEVVITTHSRTITFAPINISGFTNLEFSGLFAEDDYTFVSGTEDWDSDNRVFVEISIDGGAFAKVLQFAGKGLNTAPQLDTNFDGIGDGAALTDTFQTFAGAIAGTGSSLTMRVVLENLNNNDEDIAFDNLRITGDAPPPATLSTVFVSGIDESIEGDVHAQIVLSFDTPPNNLTTIRITPNTSDVDLGTGAGNARVILLRSNPVTITATAVDDALVEGDETALLSFELAGSLDPSFSLNPVPDLAFRLVDSDADNAPEGAYLLHQEGFETDGNGSRYTTSVSEFSDGFSDFFTRTDGSGISISYEVSGEEGSFFFAGQDIDQAVASGSQSATQTLSISNINISDFENLTFSALFAEDDNGNFQNIDNTDGIRIRAQIDSGGFFDVLAFEAGGDQFSEVAQLDTNFNGIGDGAAITDTFTRYAAAIAGTGNSLDLEIEMSANSGAEDFAIDDIRVTGDRASDLDILTTGFVDIFEGGQSDTIIARIEGTPDAGDVIRTVLTWDPTDYVVNGNATGALTVTALGSDWLADPDGQVEQTFTLTAIDDADDELLDQGPGQFLTIDVQSPDDVSMDALGPQTVTAVRVWDNDGPTGADPDGAFVLHQEGFETDGAGTRYTLSRAEFNNQNSTFGGDWFTRTIGGADLENASTGPKETYGITGGSEGSFFFGVQDPNGAISGANQESLTIIGIDIAEFENLHFDIDIAEDDQDDGREDWNASTFFSVEARIDSGAFVEILRIEGTDQTDHEPGQDTDFDTERDGIALSETFREFGADIIGTGQDLDIRLTWNDFLFSGEDFAIDDIRVTGDRASDLDILTTGFVDIFEGGQSDTIIARIEGTPDAGDVIRTVLTWDPTDYVVNGNATGALTVTALGSDWLADPDGQVEQTFTLTAIDDADDELLDQGPGQFLTIDVQSPDDVSMDALGPQTVTAVRVWDNDGPTGADPDGAFVLHQEGFETDGAGTRYTLSRAEFNNQNSTFGGDWFTRTIGGADLENASTGPKETYGITGGSEGSFFFGVQDPNGAISGANQESLTIIGIDIAEFENLHFDIDIAEDDQDDGREDWNASTFFSVEARIDSGAFVEILRIEGTDQTDHEPGQDTDFDTERDGIALSETFREFGADIIGTGQDLDIRLTWNDFLFSGEDFAIDDIRVTGDRASDLDILTTGFVDIFEGGQSDTIIARIEGTPDAGDVIRTVLTWDPTDYVVNGNATGALTVTALGSDWLADPDGQVEQTFTLTAIDDADDELLDQGPGQFLTIDVQSPDDVSMDALGPQTVTAVRVWDNDGPTGADPDGAFVLHQEGFETDGAGTRYTLSRAEFNNQNSTFGGDWFTRTIGGADLENASTGPKETYGITGGSEGSFFFGVQDPNGAISGANQESLTIIGIDIAEFENLHFDIDIAEDDQDDGREDWNASTFFSVEARIDSGAFVEILRIEGTDQTDHEPGQDTDFDTERDGIALSETFREFGADIIGTGQDLDIRLTWNDFLFSGEDIAIDDIRVTGDAGPFFEVTGDNLAGGNPIADSSFGVIDGIDDFSGFTGAPSFVLRFVGADSVDELLLGQSVRILQQGTTGILRDANAEVLSTNLDGGIVLLGGADIVTEFGVSQIAILDAPASGGVVLEIGPSTPPVLVSTSPPDNAVAVAVDETIELSFDEPVQAGSGTIEIRRSADDILVQSFDVTGPFVTFAGTIVEVDPNGVLPSGTGLYLKVAPGAIRDLAGNPFKGIDDETAFNFSTNFAPETEDSLIVTNPGVTEQHVFSATDPEDDPLSFAVGTPPGAGFLSVETNGEFKYAAPGLEGEEKFSYDVSDPNGNTVEAVVRVQTVDASQGVSLSATDGNDVIRTGLRNDRVDATGGSDRLMVGQGGSDLVAGGDGDDLFSFVRDAVANAGDIQVFDGGTGSDRFEVENLTIDAAKVFLLGDGGDDEIVLNGDLSLTGAGILRLDGGDGSDVINLSGVSLQQSADSGIEIDGGDDSDTIQGSSIDDTLEGGAGSDTLDGGSGSDTASYEDSDAAVIVAVDGAFAIGGDADGDVLASIENLLGSAFADFLRGDGQANVLTGGAGADYIQGRGGDDTLNGGENDDLLEPGAGADTVDGGAGQDLLSALDAAGPVTINLGNVALSSAGYADKTLISIEGVLGVAGFGNTLVGGGGEDLLIGGDVADSIAGAGGADILLGLGGADTISGGAGDDLILGLEGDDVLTGDAGRDLFLFEPGDGADVVTDFELPVGGSGFEDRLFFSGLGIMFADLDIAEVGGDVVIGYGTNPAAFDGSVTVEGVTLADLVPGGAQPDWILVF